MRPLITLLLLVLPCAAQDILVIAPKEFHAAIADWKAHREKQGHKVAVLEPGEDPRATVRKARTDALRFVVIVGDVKQVPAHVFPAVIIKKWEKDPRIFTDNRTADLDGDHLPDVAIGRIPADSADEAKAMLAKVIDYENDTDATTWRRRINVVAGIGGFGAAQDAAIVQAASTFLKESIPPSYDLHVTYANPTSPFCPAPSQVMKVTSERFNEGALFVAYIGHGWRNGFDRLRFKGTSYRIFTEDAAFELNARRGLPIAFLLCCSTGHFDGTPDCIAEVMVKRPRGPIAVIASSRVSMPYGNAPLAKELLEATFVDRTPTLGEAFRLAKLRSMDVKRDAQRTQIEVLAWRLYEPDQKKRDQERVEHLYLYNLLGDPSLRIPHPAQAKVAAPSEAAAGTKIDVSIQTPIAGAYRVELVRERSAAAPMRANDTDEAFDRAYRNANRWVRANTTGTTGAKPLKVSLALPAKLRPGRYDVRFWVEGTNGQAAAASAPIKVTEPVEPD